MPESGEPGTFYCKGNRPRPPVPERGRPEATNSLIPPWVRDRLRYPLLPATSIRGSNPPDAFPRPQRGGVLHLPRHRFRSEPAASRLLSTTSGSVPRLERFPERGLLHAAVPREYLQARAAGGPVWETGPLPGFASAEPSRVRDRGGRRGGTASHRASRSRLSSHRRAGPAYAPLAHSPRGRGACGCRPRFASRRALSPTRRPAAARG